MGTNILKNWEKTVRILAEEHSVESVISYVDNLLAFQREENAKIVERGIGLVGDDCVPKNTEVSFLRNLASLIRSNK